MAKRKRDVPVLFWVSAEELELIHQKMQQYGTENLSAYLRKNGAGWLCGQAGTARAEGVGLPDAPKQQQLESADPQSA